MADERSVDANPPPIWLLRARAPSSAHWQEIRVAAESLVQADAILRRKGLVVNPGFARRVEGPQDDPEVVRVTPPALRARAAATSWTD